MEKEIRLPRKIKRSIKKGLIGWEIERIIYPTKKDKAIMKYYYSINQ